MKVLDVHAFESGMDETRQKITTLSSQLKQAEASVNQLISLSDAFKGDGPQAILTFFEQYHKPLLNTYHTFCADYQLTIEQMRHALVGCEPAPNGFIRQSFLENELNQGLIRARTITIELTNEANAIIQTVSDIVALPPLREDSVIRACDEAIQFKQQTIEKLVQFDILQTKALAPIESLLQSTTNQIQFMEDIFIQGDTSIHVNTTAVAGLSCERPETAIKEKTAWYEVVGNVILGAIEGIVKAVVDIFKGLFDLLKSLFTDPIGFFKGIGTAIFNPVDTFNAMWGAVETAWERDVINGDARSRASFFSYAVVSVVGLKGIDKIGKAGKLGTATSKADNGLPYNAMQTDKLKGIVQSNVYVNMQQKAKQTADLLKSSFSKEAMNKTIQAAKNSDILRKARNTLNPTNIKTASTKLYADVVKSPIAKTQAWMQKKKEQILNAPLPNIGSIPLGPTMNMTVRDGIDAARNRVVKIVGDKDGEGKGTKGKIGVGKTGEGIPLEEVKPDVLKKIHPDNNGAYGYLPKKGTYYDKPINNFTNVEWAKEMQAIRKEYLEETKKLERDLEKMTAEGFSKEKIAEHLVEARNQQKIASRKDMPAEERAALEERNIEIYGNPIGPTAKRMFNDLKDDYIDKEIYKSDEQIWEIIIQKSMKKDDVLNTLLGIKY